MIDRFVQAAQEQEAQRRGTVQPAPTQLGTVGTGPYTPPPGSAGTTPPKPPPGTGGYTPYTPKPAPPGTGGYQPPPQAPQAPTYTPPPTIPSAPAGTGGYSPPPGGIAGTGPSMLYQSGVANPGVETAGQQTWQGGPGVTLARTGANDLPGLSGGVDLSGMPNLSGGLDTREYTELAGGLDISQYPELAAGLDTGGFADFDTDFAGASDRAAREAYAGATQFMDEDFSQDTNALRTQLVNQGLQPGTEAYDREMALLQRGQNAARTQAAYQAGEIGHRRAGDLLTRALETRRLQADESGQDASQRLAARGLLGQEGVQDAAIRANSRGLQGQEGVQDAAIRAQARGILANEQNMTASQRLAARQQLMGERERDADRVHNQSLGVAGLMLGARGQDTGMAVAQQNAAGNAAAAGAAAQVARENAQLQREIALRGIGLQQDQFDFSSLMQLINAARGGVNVPNFGGAAPLDVGGAYGIASNNQNTQNTIDANNRGAFAGLGAAAIGSLFR